MSAQETNHKSAPLAYSPKQFCRVANISLSLLYALWRDGKGPKYGHARTRRIITHQDGMEWLQQLTARPKDAA